MVDRGEEIDARYCVRGRVPGDVTRAISPAWFAGTPAALAEAPLQRAAEKANLPVSTLIRLWALDRLRFELEGNDPSVAERLTRLERAVFQGSA